MTISRFGPTCYNKTITASECQHGSELIPMASYRKIVEGIRCKFKERIRIQTPITPRGKIVKGYLVVVSAVMFHLELLEV